MNRTTAGIALILGLAVSSTAMASGAFTGRVGVTGGNYEFNDQFTDQGCCGNPAGTVFTSDDSSG